MYVCVTDLRTAHVGGTIEAARKSPKNRRITLHGQDFEASMTLRLAMEDAFIGSPPITRPSISN